jgi:hypothetical protein
VAPTLVRAHIPNAWVKALNSASARTTEKTSAETVSRIPLGLLGLDEVDVSW